MNVIGDMFLAYSLLIFLCGITIVDWPLDILDTDPSSVLAKRAPAIVVTPLSSSAIGQRRSFDLYHGSIGECRTRGGLLPHFLVGKVG